MFRILLGIFGEFCVNVNGEVMISSFVVNVVVVRGMENFMVDDV